MLEAAVHNRHPFAGSTPARGLGPGHDINLSCDIGLSSTCLLPGDGCNEYLALESEGLSDASALEGEVNGDSNSGRQIAESNLGKASSGGSLIDSSAKEGRTP